MLRFARSHFAHLRGADGHISDFASPRRPRRQGVAVIGAWADCEEREEKKISFFECNKQRGVR